MKSATKTVALVAVLSAIAVVLLMLSCVIPMVDLTLIVAASFCTAVAVWRGGVKAGIMTFAVVSLLSLILLPDKTKAVGYILMFGYYPVVKLFLERIKSQPVEWLLKLAVINAGFFVNYALFRLAFTAQLEMDAPLWLIAVFYNIAFILLDIAITRVVYFLAKKLQKMRL